MNKLLMTVAFIALVAPFGGVAISEAASNRVECNRNLPDTKHISGCGDSSGGSLTKNIKSPEIKVKPDPKPDPKPDRS